MQPPKALLSKYDRASIAVLAIESYLRNGFDGRPDERTRDERLSGVPEQLVPLFCRFPPIIWLFTLSLLGWTGRSGVPANLISGKISNRLFFS
jgi:hypothetical protein